MRFPLLLCGYFADVALGKWRPKFLNTSSIRLCLLELCLHIFFEKLLQFGVYLGVKTCEISFCFVAIQ